MALGILSAGLLAGLLVALGLQLRQRRHLRELRGLLEELLTGQVSRRGDVTAPGLSGQMAHSINLLAAQMEAERADARRMSNWFETFLAQSDQSLLMVDAKGRVLRVNPAACKLFDLAEATFLGRPIVELLNTPEATDWLTFPACLQAPQSHQLRLPRSGKHLTVAMTTTPLPGAMGLLVLMRDLTELLQALQIKAEFAANASHELRTPLASIRAAVETIQEAGLDDRDTLRHCLDIVSGHVLRLQMLIQDLLDLSRTEDPRAVIRKDRLSLQRICDSVLSLFAGPAADRQIALQMQLDSDAQWVRGDERLLTLTLKNLVDNSLKFTTQGEIVIRSYRQESGLVALEVQDTGCGIAMEDQQRVFERFYTVNRSRGGADRGTGLGLAIVKHAVGAMGGQIQLESQPGHGTTLRCLLPG